MGRITPRTITTRNGRRVVIRSPELDDAQTLLDLCADYDATSSQFSVTQPDERGMTLEKEREWIGEHLDGPNRVGIIAAIDTQAIGILGFKGNDKRRITHHGSFGIGVHSQYREEGIGRAMIQALLDWAAAHPVIEKVNLGVLANNPRAIHLYESMGFVVEGRKSREFRLAPGEYIDGLDMGVWVKKH